MRKTILTLALLASMSAMAQENAEVDVHARYTKVVTPVNGKYESKRPPVEDRLFTSTAVEKKIKEVQKILKKNPKLAWMFANCYPNTLRAPFTTVCSKMVMMIHSYIPVTFQPCGSATQVPRYGLT